MVIDSILFLASFGTFVINVLFGNLPVAFGWSVSGQTIVKWITVLTQHGTFIKLQCGYSCAEPK